jgi:hypothetical protein
VKINALAIYGCKNDGIDLDQGGGNDTITSCFIGTDTSGTATGVGNGRNGVGVVTNNNTIGNGPGTGNLISGNALAGVFVALAQGNFIDSNYIGTDASGTTFLPNRTVGVLLSSASSNNVLENLISGNLSDGVQITGNTAVQNLLDFNMIGTDASGGSPLPNGGNGVNISGGATNNAVADSIISANLGNGVLLAAGSNTLDGNQIGTNSSGTLPMGNSNDGVLITSNNNTIGATTGNLISGNRNVGIEIQGGSNKVVQNYIGTDWEGLSAIGNVVAGVKVGGPNASNNTIGGVNGATTRNVISGNGTSASSNQDFGIWLANGSTGTLVQGNYIGTDSNGTNPLGNGNDGVYVEVGSNNNTIGGAAFGARNVISANGTERAGNPNFTGDGVYIRGNNNEVTNNYIGVDVNGAAVADMANKGDPLEDFGQGNVTAPNTTN